MALSTSVLLEAARDWVQLATGLSDQATIRSHQNGPAGPAQNAPYIVVTPVVSARPLGLAPSIHRQNGQRYSVRDWEIVGQLDAYRGDPFALLVACEQALHGPAYQTAFVSRGIAAWRLGDIIPTPQVKGQAWEAHAQMQYGLRLRLAEAVDVPTLKGVRVTFRFAGAIEAAREITDPTP